MKSEKMPVYVYAVGEYPIAITTMVEPSLGKSDVLSRHTPLVQIF